jgi:hypothetical protein
MATRRRTEHRLYPVVARYLQRRFDCYSTGINRGTRHGRVDVIGVRDTGKDLSGSFEVIGVEVKAGYQPFSTAAGQAHGYSIYANRCYLADARRGPRPFTLEEVDIASTLGIGLLAVSRNRVTEVLEAPSNAPMQALQRELLHKLGFSVCVLCESLFQHAGVGEWRRSQVSMASLAKAAERKKGYVYWLLDLAKRRKKDVRYYIYQRRYVCKDCVQALNAGAR